VRLRRALLPLAALASATLLAAPARAQTDGQNDNSFWTDGKRVYSVSAATLELRGLAVAPGGELVYGASWSDGVRHSNWRAVFDSTSGALCNVDLPNYEEFSVNDVAFDAQGRLLVLGFAAVHQGDTVNIPFVARYLYPACTLDGTFDQDGWTVLSWDLEFDVTGLVQLIVQPDGKLLLAGFGARSGPPIDTTPILMRLLPGGGLDTSFSVDGRSRAPLGQGMYRSAALAPNGSVLVTFSGGGGSNSDFTFDLFTPDGTHKATNVVGFDLVPNGVDSATSVTVGSDGRIYVSGNVQGPTSTRVGIAALRFLPNGFLVRDFDFADDGRLDIALAPGNGTFSQVADTLVQGDGKLIVAGRFSNDNDQAGAMAVARLLPDGSFDGGFFPTGLTFGFRLVQFDLGGTDEDAATEVLLQRGRIVLGGKAAQNSGDSALALARLHNAYLLADGFEAGDARMWLKSAP